MRKRAVIIGAGVVGLTLAKELALEGMDVEVSDAKAHVSDGAAKASGIFSAAGLGRIGLPYEEAVVNRLEGAYLYAGRERLRIRAGKTMAYVVDRAILAELCRKAAEDAGARVVMGRRLGRSELRDMASDKDSIIVGADGAVSTVASAFGFPAISEYVLTYKAEYDNAKVDDERMVGLFFSNEVTNRFFGWYVPYSRSTMEIAVGVSSRAKKTSRQAFNQFTGNGVLADLLDGAEVKAEHASMIPLAARAVTVKGNVALVGDAAGQVKATTGGGIIFGVQCAKVLSRAMLSAARSGKPLHAYERSWRRAYGTDLRMHSMAHGYYSGLGPGGFERLFRIARLLGAESFLGKFGDMDRPSLIVKRLFLRGIGE